MDTLPPAAPYAPARTHVVGPPNHLVWAILVTLFCCLPGGIVAIVYAAQVDSKFMAGDVAGAQYASDQAKLWSWISAGSILVIAAGYFLLVMAAVISGGSQ
ncbi:MAG: CD225/dispanin family protein [Arenimonas sp.]|nr:CD225/dispanin family protein [Arenimonas sp.]